MTKTLFNRRSFFKAAVAAGAGVTAAGLIGCQPSNKGQQIADTGSEVEEESIDVQRNESFDVVVCGAGASGVSAAVRAAEAGAKVALLEKTASVGGSSLSVVMALVRDPEADVMEEVNEWVADSHWRVNAEAIISLLSHSGVAFRWLKDEHQWDLTEGEGLWMLPGTIKDRAEVRTALYNAMIESAGVTLFPQTTAKKLVLDDEGAVAGVVALDEEGAGVQFDCKAVAIATGGYAANREMVQEAFGFGGVCDGLPQNIGEGLEMAWEAGAKKPINFGGQMLHQTLTPCTEDLLKQMDEPAARYPFFTSYLPHFMNVTAKGRRFRNEDLVKTADAAANSSAFQGPFHYVVVSAAQLALLEQGGIAGLGATAMPPVPPRFIPEGFAIDTPWTDALAPFEAAADGDAGFRGDTLEELAAAAGFDQESFVEECARYEEFCAQGKDTQLGKSPESLVPLGEGPYYLIKAEQNNLTSWGGLATDADYRVYSESDDPILGLWAVGVEAGGNLYNDTYVGNGVGICLAVTSGYLAGDSMASFAAAN